MLKQIREDTWITWRGDIVRFGLYYEHERKDEGAVFAEAFPAIIAYFGLENAVYEFLSIGEERYQPKNPFSISEFVLDVHDILSFTRRLEPDQPVPMKIICMDAADATRKIITDESYYYSGEFDLLIDNKLLLIQMHEGGEFYFYVRASDWFEGGLREKVEALPPVDESEDSKEISTKQSSAIPSDSNPNKTDIKNVPVRYPRLKHVVKGLKGIIRSNLIRKCCRITWQTINYPPGVTGLFVKRWGAEETDRELGMARDLDHLLSHLGKPGSRFEVDLLHPESQAWPWFGGQASEDLQVDPGDALSRLRDYRMVPDCAARTLVAPGRAALLAELGRLPPHWLRRGNVMILIDESLYLTYWTGPGYLELMIRREELERHKADLWAFNPTSRLWKSAKSWRQAAVECIRLFRGK
ncbi:MAG: hypothetical protein HQL56_09995 [Magnetococcales bacterium]|nr:hypothetical protein [Magnetococcales bacterium]